MLSYLLYIPTGVSFIFPNYGVFWQVQGGKLALLSSAYIIVMKEKRNKSIYYLSLHLTNLL